MSQTDIRSLQQIKRETEQTRAGLTDTVEELKISVAETVNDIRHRISPDTIKAEVADYVRSRGEQLVNDVTSAARKNPMQAVAVGACVAYPLLRIARAIPVPVLMVGAGLFFAGSKTGQAASQKASDVAADLSGKISRSARDLGDQVQETASAAKTYASDQFDRISSAVARGSDQGEMVADAAGAAIASSSQQIRDTVASAGASLSDGANSFKDDGLRIAASAAAAVQDMTSAASLAARQAANTVADTGRDAARTIRASASDASGRAGRTISQTFEQNPLLVAGVGLLLGGLIASAVPRTEFEDDLVGDTKGAAKRQVRAAASKGMESAKAAVGEIYDETVRQAEMEGLTADGIGQASQDITQRLRRVAEAAVTTAFEPSEENHQPSARGENDHG